MINLKASSDNVQTMLRARQVLNLPEGKRRTLMRSWGRKIRAAAKKNTVAQQNVDGSKWASRKVKYDENGKKIKKGKMLKNIAKGKHLNVKTLGSDAVQVDWGNRGIGRVAKQHQEGMNVLFNMAGMPSTKGKTDGDATTRQAKALIVSGFKVRRARLKWSTKTAAKHYRKNGASPWVTPTLSWIKNNLSQGQAGLVLRELGYKDVKTKWKMQLEKRSFLGASKEQISDMLDDVYEAMLERQKNKTQ